MASNEEFFAGDFLRLELSMFEKIISGGQTGVDRAALDIAIDLDLPYGGWCPKGRIDEIGIIPEKYNRLIEVVTVFDNNQDNYNTRTQLNIRDSDGTLIIVPTFPLPKEITDGTVLTIEEVCTQNKPYLLISLTNSVEDNLSRCLAWLKEHGIDTLNVAGPRESSSQGIYKDSYNFLYHLVFALVSVNTHGIK